MSETGKKKRGRKTKNKIILNENPVFDTSLDDILIACVKKTKVQEDLVVAETIKPNDNDEIFQEYEGAIIDKCWNCSYEINGEIYSHPISYHNNIFHMNGNFCSHECSARYIYETYGDKEFWEKYNLLNFYVNLSKNTSQRVKIPFSKLRLIDYGGDITKEEYIKSQSVSYDCYTPPCLYVNNIFYNKEFIDMKETELKLFRRNKKKTPEFHKYEE